MKFAHNLIAVFCLVGLAGCGGGSGSGSGHPRQGQASPPVVTSSIKFSDTFAQIYPKPESDTAWDMTQIDSESPDDAMTNMGEYDAYLN